MPVQAYVRVSGTWANAVYFQTDDKPAVTAPPKGFVNVMTRNQWKGVIDFLQATSSKLVTSFAVSNGVRDTQGVWMPAEAQKIADYTKSLGGKLLQRSFLMSPPCPVPEGK